MLSYKPLQDASAFRLWCKANDMSVSEYDEVAKNLDSYRKDSYWKSIIEESKVFIGVVESISDSPCSQLVWDKNISEEIGLIKTKEGICCNIDGYNCDVYKYLKNDLLTVSVWSIIRRTCGLANIPIPSIQELEDLLDEKTFDIYRNKLTCTINQIDSEYATELVSKYQPTSVAEVSAFVAGIRPGFKSLLDNFIDRKPYTTGVKELDDLLEDSYHYLMYQESIMKYLIWLGVEESETYTIIKKISKKKFKEKELEELKAQLKIGWIKNVGSEEGFNETWQVVEDASAYSFNASHSLAYAYDSLYCAYLKAHYPLEYYTTALSLFWDDSDKTVRLTKELQHFGIKFKDARFRYSRGDYFMDKETNTIYKGMASIKFMNDTVSEQLYSLRDKKYDSFIDLLIDLKNNTSIDARQLKILIKLDFFEEFWGSKKLLNIVDIFDELYDKKQKDKNKVGIYEDIVKKYCIKETEKQFKIDNESSIRILKEIEEEMLDEELSLVEKMVADIEFLGDTEKIIEGANKRECIVLDTNLKYTPLIKLRVLHNGNTFSAKISKKIFKHNKLVKGDVVVIKDMRLKPKVKLIDNQWVEQDEKEYKINEYYKMC